LRIDCATSSLDQVLPVDADTGEEVANEDIVKGYKVDTDSHVEVIRPEGFARCFRINAVIISLATKSRDAIRARLVRTPPLSHARPTDERRRRQSGVRPSCRERR
jgi:hypothetical protein